MLLLHNYCMIVFIIITTTNTTIRVIRYQHTMLLSVVRDADSSHSSRSRRFANSVRCSHLTTTTSRIDKCLMATVTDFRPVPVNACSVVTIQQLRHGDNVTMPT
jgi:hypothetical protein